MMRCPSCSGELRVTHTYTVDGGAQTRDYKCNDCSRRCSSVTMLVEQPGDYDGGRTRRRDGSSARQLAEKVKNNEIVLQKNDAKPQPD